MRTNIEILSGLKVEAIVTDCTSCAMAFTEKIKKVIPEEDPLADKACAVGKKFREVTEFLAETGLVAEPEGLSERFCYHEPCHTGWGGKKVAEAPGKLLAMVSGLEQVEMEEGAGCCGGGGTFFNEYPALAEKIRDKQLRAMEETRADVLVTQCPSCRIYLSAGLKEKMKVMHPVSLLAPGCPEITR